MTDRTRDGGDGPNMDRFKGALYRGLDQGPARLELERRRLLASLDEPVPERRTGPAIRAQLLLVAGAAAAVVVALALFRGAASGEEATLELSGLWRLEPGDAVSRGAPVTVPEDGAVKIVLPDESTLWIGSGAALAVEELDGSRIRLGRGRLITRVTPREPAGDLRIFTEHGVVIVRGTTFSVSADETRTCVRLHRGRVEVAFREETIALVPGHQVELGDDGVVAMRPIGVAERLEDMALADGTAELPGPPFPEIEFPGALTGEVELSPLPEVAAPVPPPRRPSPTSPRRSRPPRAAPDSGPDAGRQPFLGPAPELDEIVVEHTDAGGIEEERELLAELRSLMKGRRYFDAAAAAEDYLGTHPRGQFVEDAMYVKGYCEARAGDPDVGRETLESYMTRYPEGRYWDHVRQILGD